MEIVSLESEYKRMTAEIKELRELLGEVWKYVTKEHWYRDENTDDTKFFELQSRVKQKLEEENV